MTADDEPETAVLDSPDRRTVLYLVATAGSYLVAVLLNREVFYRGYGEDGYGTARYGE